MIPTAALRSSYSTSQLKELRLERLTHLPKVSQLVKGQVGSVEQVSSGGQRGGLEAKPGEGGADGQQRPIYITPPGLVTLAGVCAGRSYDCQNLEVRSLVQGPGTSPWGDIVWVFLPELRGDPTRYAEPLDPEIPFLPLCSSEGPRLGTWEIWKGLSGVRLGFAACSKLHHWE